MSFIDARRLDEGAVLEADVCVVGAGAAGIVLARSLGNAGLRVCLLESGGIERSERHQRLYHGERIGHPYPPLQRTRLRYFGGTTNHWAGWCRPPRAEDFAARPWIADSGWPIGLETLAPYLVDAQRLCELTPEGFELERWRDDAAPPLALDDAIFATRVTRFSPPTRFALKYHDSLAAIDSVQVYLEANVTGLVADRRGGRVERVTCRTLDGNAFDVRASRVVLATGGIENARLLLASRGVTRRGLGNARDVVGRYFMDHFKYRVGVFEPAPGVSVDFYQRADRDGSALKGVVGLTEPALRRASLTPMHFEFWPVGNDGPPRYRVDLRLDPSPNPASRIVLDRVTDRLGLPRVILDLRYGELEARAFLAGSRLLREGLGDAGLGTLRLDDDALPDARITATGFHHMGATRMSDDPATGVVDRHCRVHGVENLYVAGCSVFPGYEGYPTMTLVALALRLADHLSAG